MVRRDEIGLDIIYLCSQFNFHDIDEKEAERGERERRKWEGKGNGRKSERKRGKYELRNGKGREIENMIHLHQTQ